MSHFDVCIVGAGTFGSTTAYHLSKLVPELSVLLIGPEEPSCDKGSRDREVFGCHYDEGRVTRVISNFHRELV